MGKLLRACGLLALVALAALAAYVAGPALSATPYIPPAVDFEQPLGALERVARPGAGPAAARAAGAGADRRPAARAQLPGTGPVSFRSPPITTPERFDLAGIAGERRPVELRAREHDGEWSEWVVTANGDPVYFGGAEQVQVRARGWRPAGRLHFVNVSGTTSGLDSLLTRARRAVNSAVIAAASLLEPEAVAAPAKPAIISRRAWGANRKPGGCPPRRRPEYGRVKAAAVHHTVTASDYTEEEAPAIVLGICRYHRNANGWNDIGYNALVDRFGNVYAGRQGGLRRAVIGAHAQGFNSYTTGVAVLGTHTILPVPRAAKLALVEWLAWKLSVHGVAARGKTVLRSAGGPASRYPAGRRVRKPRILGHRQLDHTTCPGQQLFRNLRQIRRLTANRIRTARDAPADPAPAPPAEPAPPPDSPPGGGVMSR